MGTDEAKNLLIFHRDAQGQVNALIEQRKFDGLPLRRDTSPG